MELRQKQQSIAVIGVSCYYPGAANTRELWENILARRVQFRRMLDQRLPLSEYFDSDPGAPEKTYGTKAAFIEDFFFDWMKARIPKKTFQSTDIAHWLALDTALRAFEDAGFQPADIPLSNTGVIVGNTLTGEQTRSQTLRLRWPFVQKVLNATLSSSGMGVEEISRLALEMEKVYKSAFYPITEDSLAGGLANTIAGRICNFLNLKGGGYIVDGACSSSLLAVATAANALKFGDMDLALAGGVDVSLDPFELVGFSRAGALAKDHMRVYDQRASGFVPGEGCGFVLLKRWEDALRDKNYIYAVINGWGISSDGKGGIMEPSAAGQAMAIQRAYKGLSFGPCDVDFIEGHGTGTTKGDRVELEGIAAATGLSREEGRQGRVCGVTSFKSIVGHTKAAAGVGGLIKAVMAVNQRILPPTANCAEPNDVFKDTAKHLYPLIHGAVLASDRTLRAGISSAGFGGINCHITIESGDASRPELKPAIEERSLLVNHQETEVFVFAARTTRHLKKIISRFKDDLRHASQAEMADLAALLGRKVKSRLSVKAAIVTDSPEHLYDALTLLQQEIDGAGIKEGEARSIVSKDMVTVIILGNAVTKNRIGFLYPGQGSQRLNMTRVLVERFPWARDIMGLSGLPLYEHIYKTADKALTREEQQVFEKQLADTRITQPAIIACSAIWSCFLSKLGVEPCCVGGHSLGELTALYKAGALDAKALLKFAEYRGALMADGDGTRGGMASLACSLPRAEALVRNIPGNIIIANINSPQQVVVSGGKAEVERAMELAVQDGIAARALNVSNAFHSSFMRAAADKIRVSSLVACDYRKGTAAVYSAMDGEALKDGTDLRDYFSRQVVAPVAFVDLVKVVSGQCDILIEVGHGKVLTGLVAAINKEGGPLCLPVESSPGKDADINRVLAELFVRNVAVRWEELYANRLIKAFVPASRKKFIMNQCERPLKSGERLLKAQVLEMKGAGPAVPAQEAMSLPLNVDDKDVIGRLLVDLVHNLTGFDKGLISLNSRLLDDLNLDSIKAAELIAKAARGLGVAGQVDPSQLSNNTLGQVRDRLHEVLLVSGKSGDNTADDLFKRYQDRIWVRNFAVRLEPEEILPGDADQGPALKEVVVLSDKADGALAVPLARRLMVPAVGNIFFGESASLAGVPASIDCLVAVLPRKQEGVTIEKDLRVIMGRLHQVIDLGMSARLPAGSCVVLVQFGGGAFGEGGEVDNETACCGKALVSTLSLERADLKVRVLDVDPATPDKTIAEMVAAEISTRGRFNAVGYDASLTRRVAYVDNIDPASYHPRGIHWSGKDVVVVSGGAKGITAVCALEFARITKARMVLLGRSPFSGGVDQASGEIGQTLEKYRQSGLKGHYVQCDVTRDEDVVRVMDDIRRRFGKITGFIHGAGLNSLKRLKQVTASEAYKESLPKVMGAVNVCRALSAEPPKLVVGITSIIGVTGMQGSGWYGFANDLLNLHLHQFRRRHPATQVVAVAYSIWDEIGMGAKLGSVTRLSEQGISPISVAEGVRRFAQLLAYDPGVQQVIVAARLSGLDTWRSRLPKIRDLRFLENVRYFVPGVELVAQARLSVQDDPYLIDHNWRGSLLFPFVFGFEAMAQAVARLIGVESFERIKAEDISLAKPIPVPADHGTTIEIHALALEGDGKNSPRRVKVSVYSQETAFLQTHFSAVFEIDPVPRKQRNVSRRRLRLNPCPGLDVQTDVYGPILFQGKLFQCIDRIHDLYYDERSKKGACVFTSMYNKSAAGFLRDNKKFTGGFLTGDPFFIDSFLQSMQVIIPKDISLPMGIGKIELDLGVRTGPSITAGCHISKVDADHYRGDVGARKGGACLWIEDCRLKVLDTVVSNPSANDLADPSCRDEAIIKERMVELSAEIGFAVPVIKCRHDERLIGARKELRHKVELPLIRQAAQDFFKSNKMTVKAFKVRWLGNGKPVIEGKGIKDVGVSLSHEGAFLLVVVGKGIQGCDVETVRGRGSEEWRALLGAKNYRLLEASTTGSGGMDFIGTAVWCCMEVASKTVGAAAGDLAVAKMADNYVCFSMSREKEVVSLRVKLTNGLNKVLALFIGTRDRERGLKGVDILLKKLGYDPQAFDLTLDYSGPQGQFVFIKSHPVTFRTNKLPSKNVYFTGYFDWLGEVREQSANPIIEHLAGKFASGEWGLATYSTKLEVLGSLKASDILETRLWSEEVAAAVKGTYDLCIDWHKKDRDGSRERVAFTRQRIIWVKVVAHGVATVAELPDFLEQFMKNMAPRRKVKSPLEVLPERYRSLDKGQAISIVRIAGKDRPVLFRKQVSTSFENSNLVGNIYFSNYAKWLGMTADLYFYGVAPEIVAGGEASGEFTCLKCEVDHLNEAMPFDEVLIEMGLDAVYQNGLDLSFDFFVVKEGLKMKKLAHARHEVVWSRQDSDGRLVVQGLPAKILRHLLAENRP